MITGGGGSIGSELVRQIAAYDPKQVIIVDIYENNAYDIQQELVLEYGSSLNLVTLISSVRDYDKMEMIFRQYHPELVFHAAAHKHVPLMETVPEEAVKNNIFGTFNVAKLAQDYGVRKFVMISTDKAVNPTNVMGATKRACEMIIQYMAQNSNQTDYVTTRFGNVLGSNGSVIPLFRRQIEYPLLHDYSRGGISRSRGGCDGSRRRDLRPRHGRSRQDHDPRREPYPHVRQGSLQGRSDSVHGSQTRREAV